MAAIPDNRKIRYPGQVKGISPGSTIPSDGFVYAGLDGDFVKSQDQTFEAQDTGTASLADSVLGVTYTYGSTLVQVDSHKLLGLKRVLISLTGIVSSGTAGAGELRLRSSSDNFFGINTDPRNCIFKVVLWSGTDYADLDVALMNPIFQKISGVETLRFRRAVDPSTNLPPFTTTGANIAIYILSFD